MVSWLHTSRSTKRLVGRETDVFSIIAKKYVFKELDLFLSFDLIKNITQCRFSYNALVKFILTIGVYTAAQWNTSGRRWYSSATLGCCRFFISRVSTFLCRTHFHLVQLLTVPVPSFSSVGVEVSVERLGHFRTRACAAARLGLLFAKNGPAAFPFPPHPP